jgi:3-oxoadipate enol-lactonase
MLLWTNGRKVYFDIVGDERAPGVYFAHSLAADSGMWAEQVPALLAAGYRVLRVDMRGHGGSDPAPGNYTMEQLVAAVRHARGGQAVRHRRRVPYPPELRLSRRAFEELSLPQ